METRGITFGAFDPLHYGHTRLFKNAKKQCHKLIVCVSNNDYIKKHKNRRQFLSLSHRLELISALKDVDNIDIQETDKQSLIKKWDADVIFVGDDWTPETFTGEGLGIPVVYLPYTKEICSTKLRQLYSTGKDQKTFHE